MFSWNIKSQFQCKMRYNRRNQAICLNENLVGFMIVRDNAKWQIKLMPLIETPCPEHE